MYRVRFVLAGSAVALVAALVASVALSPSYLILQVSSGNAPSQSKSDAPSVALDRAAILETQSLLTALSPIESATSSQTQMIAEALALRPAGISINHITLTSGKPGTMILAGSAKNIAAINDYRKALGNDSNFTSVSVPVGDLAGTQNGQFSITLTGTF